MGTINTNASLETLQGLINQYVNAEGVTATVEASAADPTQMVVTFTGANGVTATTTMPIPELDENGAIADADLAELQGKLESLLSGVKTTGGSTPTSISTMLFDIYSCLALLLEVEQEQKNTAALTRAQEHSAIASEMLSQADSIRAAAQISFNYGLASAIVGTCMTTISACMTAYSVGTTIKQIATSGVGTSTANLKAAQNEQIAAQKLQDAQPVEAINQDTVEAKLQQAGVDKSSLESAKTSSKVEAAQQKVDAAKDGVTVAEGQKQAAEQKLQDAQTQLSDAKAELAELKKGNDADAVLQKQNEIEGLEQNVADCQGNLETANKNLDSAKVRLSEAQVEQVAVLQSHQAALSSDVEKSQSECDKAVDGLKDVKLTETQQKALSEGKPIKLTQEQQTLSKDDPDVAKINAYNSAQAKLEAVKGLQAFETQKMAPALLDGCKAKVEQMRGVLNKDLSNLNNSAALTKAQSIEKLGGALTALGQSVSKFMDTFSQYETEMARAEQKETDARIETERAELDQMNELYSGAQDMINSVLKLMQAVMEAEGQSMQQAINV